jgi:putative membrane protein
VLGDRGRSTLTPMLPEAFDTSRNVFALLQKENEMWRVHDGMGWWMLFGALLWIAVWGTVIYIIVSLILREGDRERPSSTPTAEPSAGDDALVIVRKRYAAGEIDRDEFLRLIEDLDRSHQPA